MELRLNLEERHDVMEWEQIKVLIEFLKQHEGKCVYISFENGSVYIREV